MGTRGTSKWSMEALVLGGRLGRPALAQARPGRARPGPARPDPARPGRLGFSLSGSARPGPARPDFFFVQPGPARSDFFISPGPARPA